MAKKELEEVEGESQSHDACGAELGAKVESVAADAPHHDDALCDVAGQGAAAYGGERCHEEGEAGLAEEPGQGGYEGDNVGDISPVGEGLGVRFPIGYGHQQKVGKRASGCDEQEASRVSFK